MPVLPKRFKKLKTILDKRMGDLTVVLEEVEKPHNLSAILRSCDAVGALDVHAIYKERNTCPTFNSTAQGSQKWVKVHNHYDINNAAKILKDRGFKLYGTDLGENACDYRNCDFTAPTAFFLGAEKWGLSDKSKKLMDQSIFIPMRGMVQSLNVSVAAAILLFEALRQRDLKNLLPTQGEGLSQERYQSTLFEWAYPEVAHWYQEKGLNYPEVNKEGEILEELPRTQKLRC